MIIVLDSGGLKAHQILDAQKCANLMQATEPLKIQITPIHDVKSPELDDQQVEHLGVVRLIFGDIDKRWACAPQIQKGAPKSALNKIALLPKPSKGLADPLLY